MKEGIMYKGVVLLQEEICRGQKIQLTIILASNIHEMIL